MIFDFDTLMQIHSVAIACGLHNRRPIMLLGINTKYTANLPKNDGGSPGEQMLLDLNRMNEDGAIVDGVPLVRWLKNAAQQTELWLDRTSFFKQRAEEAERAAPQSLIKIPTIWPVAAVVIASSGLDAARKEALLKAIADCLTLEDLQTALQRCFGDPPIRVGTADQPPAIRDIALQCLDLVEREKLTAVFLSFVIKARNCSPALRREALRSFPELQLAGLSFADVVNLASEFLSLNQGQITQSAGTAAAMQRVTLLVAELTCYKGLHEAVHQVRNNQPSRSHKVISPEAGQRFRQNAQQYATLLNTAHAKSKNAVEALPDGSSVKTAEQPWITVLGGFADRVANALNGGDMSAMDAAIDLAVKTIDPRLEEFNDHLTDIAKQLLDGPIETLREMVAADALPGVNAMNVLRLALHVRMLEHTRWQETDALLFPFDDTLGTDPAAVFTTFSQKWGGVRKQIPILTDADRKNNLDGLKDLALKVENTLTSIERTIETYDASERGKVFVLMSEPYEAFRFETQQQFLRIDAALKLNCSELSRIS